MLWCQSQVYVGNARFQIWCENSIYLFQSPFSGNVFGQLFPWNLLINKADFLYERSRWANICTLYCLEMFMPHFMKINSNQSIWLSVLQDAHLYESFRCLHLCNFAATMYEIRKILDRKTVGEGSEPRVAAGKNTFRFHYAFH